MIALSHIVLHLGLCNSMLKRPPATSIAIHLKVFDRGIHPRVDETLHFERGYEATGVVSFDIYQGTYAMVVTAPGYNCTAFDYIYVLPEHNRTISEQFVDGEAPQREPMLISGTAPLSFMYLSPTYVLFDKSQACDKPVGDPVPVHMVEENDQDSFYLWVYPDASLYASGSKILAMQLQTPTGDYHYIRLKTQFPVPWGGWPDEIVFNITEDVADSIATFPTGVLLCPKMTETSSG